MYSKEEEEEADNDAEDDDAEDDDAEDAPESEERVKSEEPLEEDVTPTDMELATQWGGTSSTFVTGEVNTDDRP